MKIIKKDSNYILSEKDVYNYIQLQKRIKSLKEKEELMKKDLLNIMELKNIIKIETEDVLINYIAPTKKETFDTKKLRKDNQELYDEYVTLSDVNSSVRIKIKKKIED